MKQIMLVLIFICLIFLFVYVFHFISEEVGPQTAKLTLLLIKFMKYGIVQFLLYNYLEKSPNCIYIQNLLIIILHEQQTYTFVQFSEIAKNSHFCTPIIVNFSIPPPVDPKSFDIF